MAIMTFVPAKKKTVMVPSGPGLHLFVILTDACRRGKHLMVPISSVKPDRYHDKACEIAGADNLHPFIKRDSFVLYKEIQERFSEGIIKCVEERNYLEREDIGDALFQRICAGVNASIHIPRWAKKQFNDWPN